MRVAIHQPNYVPWLGFFYKMYQADVFVLLDDAEYTKNSLINRNQIKTSNGVSYLTIPVSYANNSTAPISSVKIANLNIFKKHLQTLELNYGKTSGWKIYGKQIHSVYSRSYSLLLDINLEMINLIRRILGIETKVILSSSLKLRSKKTDRLIEIVETIGGTEYISGSGGRKYMDTNLFDDKNIKLTFHDFTPPTYDQLWGDFVPGLSILDTLLNCGDKTAQLLL